MSDLERTVNRNILAAAVGQAMFCPARGCGVSLDVSDAVLVTVKATGETGIACSACAEPMLASLGSLELDRFEVLRGRELS